MITLMAKFDYVLMVDSYIRTKTSPKPQLLQMVYDSGSGTTTISKQVALNAGYKIINGDHSVDGIGGRVRADYTIIPDLILGGVSLGPVYVHVLEFHDQLAQKTNALLGMNVLSWFKITQDCHWDENLQRYSIATLLLEPKYNVNEKIDLNKFNPLERGQTKVRSCFSGG